MTKTHHVTRSVFPLAPDHGFKAGDDAIVMDNDGSFHEVVLTYIATDADIVSFHTDADHIADGVVSVFTREGAGDCVTKQRPESTEEAFVAEEELRRKSIESPGTVSLGERVASMEYTNSLIEKMHGS